MFSYYFLIFSYEGYESPDKLIKKNNISLKFEPRVSSHMDDSFWGGFSKKKDRGAFLLERVFGQRTEGA